MMTLIREMESTTIARAAVVAIMEFPGKAKENTSHLPPRTNTIVWQKQGLLT